MIKIIGGGLAGSEAAWQLASRGLSVTLYEMRPVRSTKVHQTDRLGELVCSNSFRGSKLENAVGLLKEEMRQLGSLIIRIANETRVPAGGALAVDRQRFAEGVTKALECHPLVTIRREEIRDIPIRTSTSPVIIATGPLSSDAFSSSISKLVGQKQLYFYDAISPIVLADSIDFKKVFRASRWNHQTSLDLSGIDACHTQNKDGDYLNCPMNEEQYRELCHELVNSELVERHDFDQTQFFEGCLPIEVMAHRGLDTLRFGPMKPVGLLDPTTGKRPHAVVQLRQDNIAADHYSLVGCQTQLKWGEQRRVFCLIPGLEQAEFVRYGMIHRNTYINAPTILSETWQVRHQPALFFAGQISGVEGYVESAASGLMAGLNAFAIVKGREISVLPRTTAMGALAYYVSNANPINYQPTNIAFGLLPPLDCPPRNKLARKQQIANRALRDLAEWKLLSGCIDEKISSVVS